MGRGTREHTIKRKDIVVRELQNNNVWVLGKGLPNCRLIPKGGKIHSGNRTGNVNRDSVAVEMIKKCSEIKSIVHPVIEWPRMAILKLRPLLAIIYLCIIYLVRTFECGVVKWTSGTL